ncbi:MAG: energy transducer TonB [Gemmatimonadales bacterium]|nr:MAG: energy transducer TonB [Gemmatimonadales bacterium]
MTEPTKAPAGGATPMDAFDTANDRLKRSFGSWFWGSMMAAVVVHFAVMAFWPTLRAADVSFTMEDMEAIELPPELEIPPPPEQIQRPANPVVSEAMIDDDVTIAPTTFEDNLPDDLPPPPTESQAGVGDQPTFTPFTVAPEVRNRNEIGRVLQREYPSTLRDAGIGGTVVMHFFIDEQGVVQNTLVAESSGHTALDQAAERVAQAFEFSPALNRDQRVPVWIQIPITFQTR